MKQVLLIMVLSLSPWYMAQTNVVKGTQSIGLNYGLSKYSVPTYLSVEYNYHFKEKMSFKNELYVERGKVGSTTYLNAGILLGAGLEVFSFNRVSFGTSLFALGGYEKTESTLNRLKDHALVYGGKASADLDYSLNERFNLNASFGQWYTRNTNLGEFFWTATLGLTYNIN